jgi:hypothetical protein
MDPDPSIFIIDLQDTNKKLTFILKKFFCILLFEGTFTSFFKDKRSRRSHKTVEILLFLLNDRRIRIKEDRKHVDPVDPHPHHWQKRITSKDIGNPGITVCFVAVMFLSSTRVYGYL